MKRRFLIILTVPLLACLALLTVLLPGLPSAEEIVSARPPASSLLLDRHGELLYRFYDEQDRIPVDLSEVPEHLVQAILAVEDHDFYTHPGFSLSGMARALRNNMRGGGVLEGGSTITQQLVKNRVLSTEKTLLRKARELVLALRLEWRLSKAEILELYLNQVAFGGAAYGVEAAALSYFDKHVGELTLSESAFLAGLLRAPSRYGPFRTGSTEYLYRKRLVLGRLLAEGWIDQGEYTAALHEPLRFAERRVTLRAPHFSLYVRDLLTQRFGEPLLDTGGLRIRTTLNLQLQEDVQAIVSNGVAEMFRHWVGNGAALVTAPGTGEILAMVGSVNYFDAGKDGEVNVTLALRQPGSTIKPLTYAMALEDGKTALSIYTDEPIELEVPDEGAYTPRNIDYEFDGEITLRQALARSRNIPAVNQLVEIGVPRFIAKAETLGIHSWRDQNPYRYALTLGSGEVRMLDLAQLFSTFPNLGYPAAPDPILEVFDRDGARIYARECVSSTAGCKGEQAFAPGVAFLINDILSDSRAREETLGQALDLRIPGHQVAVKTGTTDLLRDNWAIGYTTDRLAAVWIGNNDGSPMRYLHSGQLGASTIWNRIMRRLLLTKPEHRFQVPPDIVRLPVCSTGTDRSCSDCQPREEYFLRGTESAAQCGALAAGDNETSEAG
ncbi:penicillin-binding protein [Mangrovimicrobium sediminis]|uniref:Penicillin-binding protein n=1 Tax=Mangrovimicrobium sediminis TaxID=2562682 RepID=A0A4Z0LZ35_9GAMM|nr:transglycosylase domain-containing protein [Haliea sp. SAOS-164]TGD72643.1 penicillin-binding protein [Haliea sp. SAOS-164]